MTKITWTLYSSVGKKYSTGLTLLATGFGVDEFFLSFVGLVEKNKTVALFIYLVDYILFSLIVKEVIITALKRNISFAQNSHFSNFGGK